MKISTSSLTHEVGVVPIDPRYYCSLSTLFGSSFINSLIDNTFREKLEYLFCKSGFVDYISKDCSLEQALRALYNYMASTYRFEYIYKNTIINELLLANHTLLEATVFTEFRAEASKLDVLIVNGTTTAYEIKTELDSLERLPRQLAAYQTIFDKTYVVTCESHIEKISRIISDTTGIMILNDQNHIQTLRPAQSNIDTLNLEHIFMSLRKPEYLKIICDRFGYIPKVSNTLIYKECLALFKKFSNEEAHECLLKALRTRKLHTQQIDLVTNSIYCLKSLLLERNYSLNDCYNLHQQLQSKPFT